MSKVILRAAIAAALTAALGLSPALAQQGVTDIDPFDHSDTLDFEKTDHAQFVEELLGAARAEDTLVWLNSGSVRQIGDSADTSALKNLVGDILTVGATQVVAARIYSDKAGKEFCDHLVVALPDGTSHRTAVRRAFDVLSQTTGGALLPIHDIGEHHLALLSA